MTREVSNPDQTFICTQCQVEKSVDLFYGDKRRPSGIRSECKECSKKQHAEWRIKNPGKDNEDAKKRRVKNPTKDRERNRRHYEKNKEKERARGKKWIEDNRETYLRVAREYAAKLRGTPKGKIDMSISRGIRRHIQDGSKNCQKWESLVGFTLDDLMQHLEDVFQSGMTWHNYGEWHIDHIIPLSAFNYETPFDLDFKKAWSLNNLQPLWARDNLSKGDRLSVPFQPSLLLSNESVFAGQQ